MTINDDLRAGGGIAAHEWYWINVAKAHQRVIDEPDTNDRSVQRAIAWWLQHVLDDEDAGCLVLYGSTGSGKTIAGLRALCHAALQVPQLANMVYATAPRFVTSMNFYASLTPPKPSATLATYAQSHLLMFDDLGVEKMSEWRIEQLYALVSERHAQQLPTIVTTNLGPDDLEDKVGARTFSRIKDQGLFVDMSRPDQRKSRGAELQQVIAAEDVLGAMKDVA